MPKRIMTKKLASEPLTKGDLYELDIRLGERFTVLQGSINSLHDRMNGHDTQHNVSVVKEVSVGGVLNGHTKKAGFVGLLASLGVLVAAAIKALIGANGGANWW